MQDYIVILLLMLFVLSAIGLLYVFLKYRKSQAGIKEFHVILKKVEDENLYLKKQLILRELLCKNYLEQINKQNVKISLMEKKINSSQEKKDRISNLLKDIKDL